MAKYEYVGDGTVEIAGVGQVGPGDVVEAPTSLHLGQRDDFKTASGGAEVTRTVEAPVEQPDQTPKNVEEVVPAPADPAVAPTDPTPPSAPATPTTGGNP